MVVKKVFDGVFDDEVNAAFLKFGRGEYRNKYLLDGKRQAKKWAVKAGRASHYSIHSLRHTYAVRLYKASSYNLRLVQKQLGHRSVSTTQVYADVLDVDVDQALENLDLDNE